MQFTPIKQLLKLLLLCALFALQSYAQAEIKVTYYIPDASGSPIAATDEQGKVIWRKHYKPFGEEIEQGDASKNNHIGYTGHVHDRNTGLTYMGARYYDPIVGRFMGMDPAGVNPNDPRTFNRYAYGHNNPYKYVDPDGRESQEALYKMLGIQNPNKGLNDAAKAVANGANTISQTGDAIASDPTSWIPGAAGVKLFALGMLGAKGTQLASKTLWKSKNKDKGRIDVENPNPGQRPGQIHYQDGSGNKYLYDPETDSFPDAPNTINEKLNDDKFRNAIDKGLKYLGED